jgi:3-deoxy-7-phosphoheptulonate synthase
MTVTGAPTTVVVLLEAEESSEHEAVAAVAADLSIALSVARGHGWSAYRIGDGRRPIEVDRFERLPGVRRVLEVTAPYQLVSKEVFGTERAIEFGTGKSLRSPASVSVGATSPPFVIAIPERDELDPSLCSPTPEVLARAGASVLHGGEFSDWPLSIHQRIAQSTRAAGLLYCVGVSDAGDLDAAASAADVLYVAPKHMQDFNLLRKLGTVDRPVLLARSFGATVEEFLLAAEYILAHGNGRVIFCESGSKTPSSPGRARFEINAIPLLKKATHLPVVADPSDAVDDVRFMGAVANAAVAAGCDGFVLKLGGDTAAGQVRRRLNASECRRLMESAGAVAQSIGREALELPAPADVPTVVVDDREILTVAEDFADPQDVLRTVNSTLASVIESALGVRPHLDVIRQTRIEGPHPSWLTWSLRPAGDLLVRWTGYRIGDTVLSRNVAYVDVSRVDPKIVVRLQSGQMNLGQLFSSSEIDRFGFEFGTSADAGFLAEALAQGHDDMDRLGPYVWRRYIAATSGRAGFVVVEALPTFAWRRLLGRRGHRIDSQGGVA